MDSVVLVSSSLPLLQYRSFYINYFAKNVLWFYVVYFSWLTDQGTTWQLLGFLTNCKPSAIFKIVKPKHSGWSTKLPQVVFFSTIVLISFLVRASQFFANFISDDVQHPFDHSFGGCELLFGFHIRRMCFISSFY